ncbi:hypothetical protein [Trueperella pyogenes]
MAARAPEPNGRPDGGVVDEYDAHGLGGVERRRCAGGADRRRVRDPDLRP